MADLSIRSIRLGAMPLIEKYIDTLGIHDLFAKTVHSDPRDRVPIETTLGIALRNVILERYPLYKMGDWAEQRGLIGQGRAVLFNDDRMGRSLDRLFAADRAALISAVVLNAIKLFDIDVGRIHNDSTTVTLFGEYDHYRDTKAAKPKHGHNKDHRPDLKQLVFSLSVAADFSVPLYFKVWDGNTTDDSTHLRNWMTLRSLVGDAKFVYIADSKLCVRDSMQFIDTEGGSFVTVLPETRSEIERFQQWIQTNNPDWQKAIDEPNPRSKHGPMRTFWTFESPFLTAEGYRIVWIKSLQKQLEDAQRRLRRIEKTEEVLGELNKRIHRNREKLDEAVKTTLKGNRTQTYFDYQIVTEVEEITKQQQRGRPHANTVYRKIEKTGYKLSYCQNAQNIQYDARYDGIFPLTSNLKDAANDILRMYKYQPNLEKRHEQLKSVYNVAPVFLQNPERIEALMLLYFLGMLIASLIERDVRKEMKSRDVDSIPIYPEDRQCKAPTADRLFELFNDVRLQYVCKDSRILSTIPDPITKRQLIVLDFLKIKPAEFFKTG